MNISISKEDFPELSHLNYENLPWKKKDEKGEGFFGDFKKTVSGSNQDFSQYYLQKTEFTQYDKNNYPKFLKITSDSDYYDSYLKVRSYAPVVFSHIRELDKISNTEMLASLEYSINSKHLSKAFASGGRSANPILYTHDKKYLIKTISKEEKNILLSMLPQFHEKMGKAYSLLCRIYGLYRIQVLNKADTHILLMKNMNELSDKSLILLFDLKGSTVDRNILTKQDLAYLNDSKNSKGLSRRQKATELVTKYTGKVFKDKDIMELSFKFKLNKSSASSLIECLRDDTNILKKFNLTDYSLLVSVHRKEEEDFTKLHPPVRIMSSSKGELMYSFSVIDFLVEYNLNKNIEKNFKLLRHYVRGDNDNNISAEEPERYANRMV
eukprot:CAMPEP_0170539604 /NCGR_PEP_ID=MMETSP0209-20121228/104053_1 /TAXON_ID=665100 ORGANISM="Litonotus pictus, Strain P1" /NCGR_SAMPLE_ID=MMETSP0209 /ASSEMBLY_ACC=CAM_ASM_000301 /LENGTH=380 /DNA_ID=CAMNT_0010841611 /DNA_START=1221 /DNA_END=2359 /DNA_ORIENTATION=-